MNHTYYFVLYDLTNDYGGFTLNTSCLVSIVYRLLLDSIHCICNSLLTVLFYLRLVFGRLLGFLSLLLNCILNIMARRCIFHLVILGSCTRCNRDIPIELT
jgi:hypothetical protein